MVPFFSERIKAYHDHVGSQEKLGLPRPPIEYYHMFYADTALYGNTPGLMLVRSFYGVDRTVFATDAPFAGQNGERVIRDTLVAVDDMPISDTEKKKIFVDNAIKLLRLAY